MAQPVWNTAAGTLGTYPYGIYLSVQLSASPISPATSISYALISGVLPNGLTLSSSGLLSGTPTLVTTDITNAFTVRATDNLGNLRDRTFSISVSGTAIPSFSTPLGSLLTTQDSYWVDLQIEYTNPDPTNPVIIQLLEGSLPIGLQIDETGNIRGYPSPPTVSITVPSVVTSVTDTTAITNTLTCISTSGFTVGRPVVFTGSVFGGIISNTTYYIKTVLNSTSFTISATQNGPVVTLSTDSGVMSTTLPNISVGQPTIRTYPFALRLVSPLGNAIASYSITVINQNTPTSQGGPGKPSNTRIPTLLNTRPLTFNITNNDPYYGYYILPPIDPTIPAFIGTIQSGDFFAFKMLGNDFDNNNIQYSFSGLPSELTGDVNTGWITGTPTLGTSGISNYGFSVAVYKAADPAIITPYFNFSYNLSNEIIGDITWVTPSNLGTIFNGTISTLSVSALSDVELNYRVVSGELPPNLIIENNGEISGFVANQPTASLLNQGDTTEFTFSVEAYSPDYPIIKSTKTFTLTVLQEYNQPTDILYIKATPSIEDRILIDSLLDDTSIIPTEYLYRPTDQYFGKASSVVYEHAYGIYASSIEQYIAAVTKNHYWRNITLGELKTAVAKNSAGEIIYEVVYSQVIDNLINPKGISIAEQIYWPRPIDLGLGPWYTSITDIYTSYDVVLGQQFYTSLTPGYARTLYPNSLYNMRQRVAQELGQEYDSRLLPLWMTSQQANGDTLGYTQAWVICYTKPGLAETVKSNIQHKWGYLLNNQFVPYSLNKINFKIDRFTVDKSATYNYDNAFVPTTWTGLPSATPVPDPLDSKDFYVLFPRQTILPDKSQY